MNGFSNDSRVYGVENGNGVEKLGKTAEFPTRLTGLPEKVRSEYECTATSTPVVMAPQPVSLGKSACRLEDRTTT